MYVTQGSRAFSAMFYFVRGRLNGDHDTVYRQAVILSWPQDKKLQKCKLEIWKKNKIKTGGKRVHHANTGGTRLRAAELRLMPNSSGYGQVD